MMRRILCVFILIFGALGKAYATDYTEGQIWGVEEGPYTGGKVLIVKVEDHPLQKHVIHISVIGPLNHASGNSLETLPHFPFDKEGLDKSNLKYLETLDSIPDDWKEGYEYWHSEASEGNAGKFTITVTEAINIVFDQYIEFLDSSQIIDPNEIKMNDYIHDRLPDDLLMRIKATTDVFKRIDGVSFEQAVDLYRRDLDPESNLVIWEEMARVFKNFCHDTNCSSRDTEIEVYRAVLIISMFPESEVLTQLAPKNLAKRRSKEANFNVSISP